MPIVVPPDEREPLARREQPVDHGVVDLPGARRRQLGPGRRAVEAVEHAAVRHQRDVLPGVRTRDAQRSLDAAGEEGLQRLATARPEVGNG